MQLLEDQFETSSVRIADLILPVFAVILTGWIVGYTGYLSRALSDALIHFAYNIAMPALLIVTIAQEPSHSLINWRFLVAFGGGSLLCFIGAQTFARPWNGISWLGSKLIAPSLFIAGYLWIWAGFFDGRDRGGPRGDVRGTSSRLHAPTAPPSGGLPARDRAAPRAGAHGRASSSSSSTSSRSST